MRTRRPRSRLELARDMLSQEVPLSDPDGLATENRHDHCLYSAA